MGVLFLFSKIGLSVCCDSPTYSKGTRLGVSEHPEDNLNVFRFRLTDNDRTDIEAVLERSNGRKMITLIGDCGAEYR